MDTPIVAIICDRCRRPVVYVQGDAGGVRYFRDRRGTEALALASERDRLRLGIHGRVRPEAAVLDADPEAGMGRDRFTCRGRKHPAYERVVTRDRLVAKYLSAVAEGATQLRMQDL